MVRTAMKARRKKASQWNKPVRSALTGWHLYLRKIEPALKKRKTVARNRNVSKVFGQNSTSASKIWRGLSATTRADWNADARAEREKLHKKHEEEMKEKMREDERKDECEAVNLDYGERKGSRREERKSNKLQATSCTKTLCFGKTHIK